MDVRTQTSTTTSSGGKYHNLKSKRNDCKFSIGIDIGSTSSDIVVLDRSCKIVFSDYRRIKGRALETVRLQLEKIFRIINPFNVILAAATGSSGRRLAGLLDIIFINEVTAQAAAVCQLYPDLNDATIIEMGGQDSKLIFLSKNHGKNRIRDFALNTVCAAGTGSFLDQQAQRLGINIENEFSQLSLQSKNVPRMAGRCSVFAKSDMIHLQQQATPTCDIIAGLSQALARNLKSNLGCGRKFPRPIIFTGGVAANAGVVKALGKVFGLGEGQLLVPAEHFFTGAIGAVLVAQNKADKERYNGQIQLEKLDNYLGRQGSDLDSAARCQPLTMPTLPPPKYEVHQNLISKTNKPINAYIGVDVGSISTNIVIIDEHRRVLAKAYLMTAGHPLEAIRRGLKMVNADVAGRVKILMAAATGSGRYLTGDFIGADLVINEITAQAAGATIINPRVDTIFEIGGQDSKYISLKNGVVVDFEMNHACAAGTGSFLEEQAQRLGININGEFAELAFQSRAPVKLGERCTVFMESDLLNYQQQGAKRSDLVAGLSYSIVANYLNRVVGRRKIGDNICFQGGTAFNRAVWSAFENVTGKPILVPDHHEVTGALGAASIAAERMNGSTFVPGEESNTKKNINNGKKKYKSRFKGFDNLVSVNYSLESFTCEHCPNHCEIKTVKLPQDEPLYYGSRCDRYNLKKKHKKTNEPDAFEYRRRKLLEFAGFGGEPSDVVRKSGYKIGLPMALIYWQLLPLFAQFFRALGCEVVLSGQTDKRIIQRGVELVTAQPCFPVKVVYGHIAELIEKKVDYIFLPSIVSMTSGCPQSGPGKLCPYVQSLPYQIRTVFADKLGRTKILTVPMHMGEGGRLLRKSFDAIGKKLRLSTLSIRRACEKGVHAQVDFETALKTKGAEILEKTGSGQKLFVLVSRPYNGCDEAMNLRLAKKLAELGAKTIPMDMLNLDPGQVCDELFGTKVYWTYGRKILGAAEIIKNDRRLFAVYLSNFGCGPDSFLSTFFKDLMGKKPCLQLELDEHSADAGLLTRLEAFLESLKNYHCEEKRPISSTEKKTTPKNYNSIRKTASLNNKLEQKRRLFIPYMSDCSYGIAACFRAYGRAAEVIPLTDESALLEGRKFTTGKECLPFAITTGDMLNIIKKRNLDPAETAFFIPGSSGPCRFGMYNCMHRLVLRYAGAGEISVISPNQDSRFYKEFAESVENAGTVRFMKDVWTAVVGIDLFGKLILRLRPFAKDKQHIQDIYRQSVKRWVQSVENRNNLRQMRQLCESVADEFSKVQLDTEIRKARIGIVGEIYVRSHPFANRNIIERLEELGAACDLAPLAEWVYYINFTRSQTARRERQLHNLITVTTQNYLQRKIEKTLAEPLERRFGKLAEEPLRNVIKFARPYLHHSFEGEAILSVGKMIEYHHHGIGGVVNVMPFSCMPSTIVSSLTTQISQECDNMPILNLSFDGQEDSTSATRLEAFVEQVQHRPDGCVTASEVITV